MSSQSFKSTHFSLDELTSVVIGMNESILSFDHKKKRIDRKFNKLKRKQSDDKPKNHSQEGNDKSLKDENENPP
jgi:hypothetical protein